MEAECVWQISWDGLLSARPSRSSKSDLLESCIMDVNDDGDIVIITNEAIFLLSQGKRLAFELPQNYGAVSAVCFNNYLLIGYDSGVLLVHAFDDSEPLAYRLHKASVQQIVLSNKCLWVLFTDSVAVFIRDFAQFLQIPAEQIYPAVQKYRLEGEVMRIVPLPRRDALLAIGSRPMLSYYSGLSEIETDLIADELDAMRIRARQTASKMGSAVSSLAKGLWTSRSDTSLNKYTVHSAATEKRSIKLAPEYQLDDEERTLEWASASPDGRYVLLVDQFNGRILQFDAAAGLLTRQLKGYRGAQCDYLEDGHTALITVPKQLFLEIRRIDGNGQQRLGKLDLSEAASDCKDFYLLSPTLLAAASPNSLTILRISLKQ